MKTKVSLTIEENVEIIAEKKIPTNFDHGLWVIEEWIANPKLDQYYRGDVATKKNKEGHPNMLRLLSSINTIKEFIDEESKFLERNEQQHNKKKEKHSNKKLRELQRENLGNFSIR